MNSFYIAHLAGNSDLQKIFRNEPLWKTCMRSVVFFDEAQLQMISAKSTSNNLNLQILKDTQAYQYILEVICGLKSEIIGETQVLGQFKLFLGELKKAHRSYFLNHQTMFQNLLQDCKELREKHIKNWGGSSYGSITRKITEGTEDIYVLGNGQLAQSLIPWLKQKNAAIFGRKPKNPDERLLSLNSIQNEFSKCKKLTSLVIAAPIDNQFLNLLVQQVSFHRIIDWRTETQLDINLLPGNTDYHSFSHLADFMKNEKIKKQKHLDILGKVIQQKITLWSERKLHRPKGWEDLC